jgi:hypothetical protein
MNNELQINTFFLQTKTMLGFPLTKSLTPAALHRLTKGLTAPSKYFRHHVHPVVVGG